MKLYGLFRNVNLQNENYSVVDFYNKLHPNNMLYNLDNYKNILCEEPKTFFDFFYEKDKRMLNENIDVQYRGYIKFKKKLEDLIIKNKPQSDELSTHEQNNISKMNFRLIKAEHEYLEYSKLVLKITRMDEYNKNVLNRLYDEQNILPPDCSDDMILYKDNIIEFYKILLEYDENIIYLKDNKEYVDYIVFEYENDEVIELMNKNLTKINFENKTLFVYENKNKIDKLLINDIIL
mgnify:CR=1 FL=1